MTDPEPDAVESSDEREPAAARARRSRGEGGIAVIWLTITLFVLLGVSAFAVDLVRGILIKQEAQNAADAASLGGVVYLPGSPTTAAAKALEVSADNSFTNGSNGVTVSTANPSSTRLQVTVKQTVPTLFARVLGFNSLDISASATADYDQPVAMGSPSNTFGNQPDCTSPCTNPAGNSNPQFWFNVAGPNSEKVQGDAYTSRLCNIDGSSAADNCPGTSNGNTDYDGNGYSYTVRNTAAAGGSLNIDIFDPSMISVNDGCDDASLTTLYNNTSHNARYAPGNASQYCTGDQYFGYGSNYGSVPTTTTYTVTFDPGTPWTTSDDTPVCGPVTFTGYNGDLWQGYQSNPVMSPGLKFQDVFRKWVNVCTVGNANQGDYVLNINTTAGTGHNRGAIRASLNGQLNSSSLSIFARQRMALFANVTNASTKFYLARVLPGAAGRTLTINSYDTGDASGAGTISILPPSDSNISTFSGCHYTPPPGNSTGPPWGSPVLTGGAPAGGVGGQCAQQNIQASQGWNGQWVTWTVPIPSNYTCNVSSASGCWVTLSFAFPNGTPADTSTWTASLDGNPVRLVQ
jgi:Flp pilus assembly protein TadG